MIRTFKAADGRKVRVLMSAEQIAERQMMTALTVAMPLIVILLFALASGMI